MKKIFFIVLVSGYLYSCNKGKSNLERFKEKEQSLIQLNNLIIKHFDSVYHYYLPSHYADLSIITAVHLNNDSNTEKNIMLLQIQFLMHKLNAEEVIISENKEILIIVTLISKSFTTEKYYWTYSESGFLTDVIKSRLKLKQIEKLNNPKFSYFESIFSIDD